MSKDGEAVRDFYVEKDPVYVPGFGPDDSPNSGKPGEYGSNVSMTRQEFAEECDINVLMSKYDGAWPPPPPGPPQYLDVSDVPDLMGAYAAIAKAEEAFMRLPASVRKEFDNDPVQFVEFAQDPGNIDKLREWKLAPPKVEPGSAPLPGGLPGGLPGSAPLPGGLVGAPPGAGPAPGGTSSGSSSTSS